MEILLEFNNLSGKIIEYTTVSLFLFKLNVKDKNRWKILQEKGEAPNPTFCRSLLKAKALQM